jgi:hypothetical protein
MKNAFRSSLGMVLGCFYAFSAFALAPIQFQIDQKIPHGNQVGVGSHLTMMVPAANGSATQKVNGVFLGKIINPDSSMSGYMLLDETNAVVYFAKKENVEAGRYSFQPILKPYDQIGGTCTGYAIDHYFQQMYWSGFPGDGQLYTEISTEKGRTQLLVDSINEYYFVLQHRYSLVGVMNKMGLRFGFKCKMKQFNEVGAATAYLQNQVKAGLPVMVSFLTGTNMVDAPFTMSQYENRIPLDNRLWVPRNKGDRKSGGHSVVAAAYFENKGRPTLLMLDSDWAEPRLWDIQSYFNAKTAIEEVEFITCQ